MPLPDKPEMFDQTMDAMITLCDVSIRQLIAMQNICKAMKSDGPRTFTLPDPPPHLLEKIAAMVPKKKE